MNYDPATSPAVVDPLLTDIVRLRCEGHSFAHIGSVLGLPDRVVKRKLTEWAEEQKETREALVQRANDQLDYLWRRQLAPYCRDEESRNRALPDKTVMALLKIQEQKAKLLGLNAPTRTETALSLENASDEDLRKEAEILGLPIPEVLTGVDYERPVQDAGTDEAR